MRKFSTLLEIAGALLLLPGAAPAASAPSTAPDAGLRPLRLDSFAAYQPVAVVPQAPPGSLPIDWAQIPNATLVTRALNLTDSARQALQRQGFVVVPDARETDMVAAYAKLAELQVPNFITSDALLHLYHAQFDDVLRTVETNQFLPRLKVMSQALWASATNQYASNSGDLREAARRNVAFFTVARQLLGVPGAAPDYVAAQVNLELDDIAAHAGLAPSPLFLYPSDYSQYVPRGHYTRGEDLKNYFKAMMWYGQMSFLLKGGQVPGDALLSAADARVQTLQAALITLDLDRLEAGGQPIADSWNRIYAVTAFFAGLADDLTPYDYKTALGQVFGAQVAVSDLADDAKLFALKKELATLPNPQIYGGTGAIALPPNATAADLDRVLAATTGMRFMGQRFIPDSYMFQQLVFPAVGRFGGIGDPFTQVLTDAGPIRGFPRGLDVMAVLGSARALDILDREGDTAYAGYDTALNALSRQFQAFGAADWYRNLYWGWLFTLQPLLGDAGPGHPAFMQTPAWQDKQLRTALASWTELRHDTILYAKQSSTVTTSVIAPDLRDRGYVEPVPEFFNRLKALTQITRVGLTALDVLDPAQTSRLNLLENVLGNLTAIAVAELENRGPSDQDDRYIRQFDQTLAPLTDGLSDAQAGQTTLVADVHTDGNSGQVLEEGVGYVQWLVAGYPTRDGRTVLGAGPVFSYYEFKQPMNNRLTDELWTNLLTSANAPARPDWVASFADPVTRVSSPDATNSVRFLIPHQDPGGLRLLWSGEPTGQYRVFYSEDLSHWLLLGAPVPGESGMTDLLDPAPAAADRRFYRLMRVQ